MSKHILKPTKINLKHHLAIRIKETSQSPNRGQSPSKGQSLNKRRSCKGGKTQVKGEAAVEDKTTTRGDIAIGGQVGKTSSYVTSLVHDVLARLTRRTIFRDG